MNITLVEPFFTGSHQQWALGLQANSRHQVHILSLPGRYWKWRMFGGAVSLAHQFNQHPVPTDLFLLSDMTDAATFKALLAPAFQQIPIALYFHENQITYPWSPNDPDISLQRNNQYGFINYTSALIADQIFFNSNYHRQSFLDALPAFLRQFPDHQELHLIENIRQKSEVLPLGLSLKDLIQQPPSENNIVRIVWNHRWEYDKNPDDFFELLFELQSEGLPFQVIVLGQAYGKKPAIFAKAKEKLKDRILHFGYANTRSAYAKWLASADVLPVTSNQDFFGISVVEALAAGCFPLLPNRLAYPQHIPDSLKAICLYNSREELKSRLKEFIINKGTFPSSKMLSDFVAQYDWSNLAALYDQVLSQITKV
ncbi:MAG: DUF3524 domain-containing protein [Saprospiraceae bacterium]|nr:DUF3524 domain-containing protein [Saprospiraceae bacterium]